MKSPETPDPDADALNRQSKRSIQKVRRLIEAWRQVEKQEHDVLADLPDQAKGPPGSDNSSR
jgi:hypothetical protein